MSVGRMRGLKPKCRNYLHILRCIQRQSLYINARLQSWMRGSLPIIGALDRV